MAFLSFRHVRIAGVAAGVPKRVVSNLDLKSGDGSISSDYSPEAFVELTGVKERHVSEVLCTSDLCFAAAETLIADLKWEKSDIDGVIFVSQTADYPLPATACILQHKLGLSKGTYAADMSLGCSGWVYGLSAVMGLVSSGCLKKVLLLVGDAKKIARQRLDPLFGHSGTATAVEFAPDSENEYRFDFGTDGGGFDAIIIPDGGSRNQVKPESFELHEYEGKMMHALQTHMKGMDVFGFGITVAPRSVKRLAEHFGFDYLDHDYFLFHQANMKMNDMIVKKLRLPREKVPSEMYNFGNNSSGSIPLLMVTQVREQITDRPARLLCCAFGVGLSWGTVEFTETMRVSKLVEVEEEAANYGFRL